MKFRNYFILFLGAYLISILMFNCKKSESKLSNNSVKNNEISIAAAANLREVLEELKHLYVQENSNKTVNITFGSSGLLVQQIINGAPFDLILSADSVFPNALLTQQKNSYKPVIYTYGKVAMWSSKSILDNGLRMVLNPEIKRIAIANPDLAPYGKKSVEVLKNTGYYKQIEHKIVWAENVNQAAQFASTGNADVAFVAFSSIQNDEMKKGNYYVLSEKECPLIPQSGLVLQGENQSEAQHFFDFIRSQSMAKIWMKYGYNTVNIN